MHDISNAAFSHEPAWHGLGTVVPKDMAPFEGLEAAGLLQWDVEKRQLYYPLTTPAVDEEGNVVTWGEAPAVALVRTDTERVLGTVTDRYEPFRNREHLLPVLDRLAEMSGGYLESALELGGGIDVVGLIRTRDFDIRGDRTVSYICVANNNSGNGELTIFDTEIRVVCRNTLQAGMGRNRGKVGIRHTASIHAKTDLMLDLIEAQGVASQEFEEVCRRLAGAPDHAPMIFASKVYDDLFPEPAEVEGDTEGNEKRTQRWAAKKTRAMESMVRILKSPTCGTEATKATLFGSVNAITEWLDFERPGTHDVDRARAMPDSVNADRKRRAFELAVASLD